MLVARNFKGKSLARASTHKSPAIIEYPGIINSLDEGQSKDDLIPGSWITDKFYSSSYATEADSNNYFYFYESNDKFYSTNGESDYWLAYEIPFADIGTSNYSIRGQNYRTGSYNNGNRNVSYYTTWYGQWNNSNWQWDFDEWYNTLIDWGTTHSTDNPFFVQFEKRSFFLPLKGLL